MWLWLAVAGALVCAGCSGKSSNGRAPANGESDACAALTPKLEALYGELRYDVSDDEAGRALAVELARANVDMVLADCRTSPETVIACVGTARSVEDIEGKCVIPLDDDGQSEQHQFGGK